MTKIKVENLTKDYGHGRGVFDISFEIKEGEIYGFLGPNGAGKSTTIRHLMGFSKPDRGRTQIFGKDSFKEYSEILLNVGYIPGEIALPAGLTGWEFIDMMKKLKHVKTDVYLKKLLDLFELDPTGETKRMSLGIKRKLAIVTAFMGNPDVLILDEPTSGLDPAMQEVFVGLIKEEKKAGKTIMLSSHLFNEIDSTCDRIAIIKDGVIVSEFIADDLRHASLKNYKAVFKDRISFDSFSAQNTEDNLLNIIAADPQGLKIIFSCEDKDINKAVKRLSQFEILHFTHLKETLEDYFMSYYIGNKDFGGL